MCLSCLTLLNSTRDQATMEQKALGAPSMGDTSAFLGLPLWSAPSPSTPGARQESLPGIITWDWIQNFSSYHWGGKLFLRCLWTHRSALPCAHVAPGDALTPTTLLRCVFTILYNVWLFMSLNVCYLNLYVTLLRSTSLKPYTHFQYPFHSFTHAAFKETQFTTSTFTQEKKKAPS